MKRLMMLSALITALFAISQPVFSAEEKWQGLDEKVVGRIAEEHGRPPKEPLINTGEGDLQLFVFLMAGVAGGFAAGYYWRALLDGRPDKNSGDKA